MYNNKCWLKRWNIFNGSEPTLNAHVISIKSVLCMLNLTKNMKQCWSFWRMVQRNVQHWRGWIYTCIMSFHMLNEISIPNYIKILFGVLKVNIIFYFWNGIWTYWDEHSLWISLISIWIWVYLWYHYCTIIKVDYHYEHLLLMRCPVLLSIVCQLYDLFVLFCCAQYKRDVWHILQQL